ncbi:hypothetical protein HBI56_197890 [Parastagonospora nodorum]|nr:hypothetical protein HBH53_202590 [Parastagonospora nodorum]KAH3959546.1 hypothetical protein HBH51_197940 [Parastagonospora nodorum]KAH3963937.1 hypothetical protein HBH52_215690 [Parastagonospora nodorum]KAH3992929.1 hypothetical protein HBI10_211110 [Parastagonospora nodorum]KAH4010567.1 hypothetical protein HBI09_230320 [Parastagonospora nodorum]
MPSYEDVLEDFGFNNVTFRQERNFLFGVYPGIYLSGGFSSKDLNDWRVAGVLVNKVKAIYSEIPETRRGRYFPWFLENLHVLDQPMSKEEAQQKLVVTLYDKAKPYLDIEDRSKAFGDLKPQAKRHSYHLLAGMQHRWSPNPIEENWYSFGFVTCRNRSEERTLLGLYQLLLIPNDEFSLYRIHNRQQGTMPPVTFKEFWKAYESKTLIMLMDSKGLREVRSRLPFLEDFLSAPASIIHPSVWDLKQFLETRNPVENPPTSSVSVDYGFENCRTREDACTMMEIYNRVLWVANPLELHEACVAGNLLRFVGAHVKLKQQWALLLENHYPLKPVGNEKME